MKPKHLILVLLSLFIYSCNNDDDSNNSPKGYFTTRIEKTDFTNANFNRIYDIEYNSQNQIALISATSPDGEVVTFEHVYTNGLLTQILATGAGTSNTTSHEFVYTAVGILSSYIVNDNGSVSTYPITYNAGSNAYTLTDEDEDYTIDFDTNNTIEQYILPLGAITIQSNSESNGVFQHVETQIGTHLLLGMFNGDDFYFFNPNELESVSFEGTVRTTSHTRDSNNRINVVNYLQGDTNVKELQITYQQRNL